MRIPPGFRAAIPAGGTEAPRGGIRSGLATAALRISRLADQAPTLAGTIRERPVADALSS
jgi:hypothetical protein